MKAAFQKRLTNLEYHRLPVERLNIFRVPPDGEEGAVRGFTVDGGAVALRLPNESLERLQERAAAALIDHRPAVRFMWIDDPGLNCEG